MHRAIAKWHQGSPRYLATGATPAAGQHIEGMQEPKMVQFAIALVSIKVFRWVTLSYLTTGHTHSAIDQTFGQLAVKLSHREPQDDKEVVAMLNEFLPGLGIDTHSRANSRCYKLDEAADWQTWIEQHGVNLSSLTGPGAPHYFRICLRGDIAEKTCAMPHARQAERQPHQPTNALAAAPEIRCHDGD